MNRFIVMLPQSVIVGFCNGLAIVIGLAQLHPFKDPKTHHWKEGADFWCMLLICLSSMMAMEFLPKLGKYKFGYIFKVVPSSLLAIVVACFIEFAIIRPAALVTSEFDPLKPCLQKLDSNTCVGTMTIKDASEFTAETAFPVPFFVPYGSVNYDMSKTHNFDALTKIIIQGFLLCLVGSIESLLTSEVVESFTKTPSDGKKTLLATGVGNFLSGLMGGMGGNAMIGLSTVNCLNGGTGRLAPTVTALLILVCCVGAYPMLNLIPVAALAGIMLVVVLHTFKWFSLRYLLQLLPSPLRERFGIEKSLPAYEVVVILAVTILANWPAGTNIAYAVCAGTALSALGHAWSSSNAMAATVFMDGDKKIYDVGGPLSFAYANRLLKQFNPVTDPDVVEVRLSYAQAMDYTAMHVLKTIQASYEAHGKQFSVRPLAPGGRIEEHVQGDSENLAGAHGDQMLAKRVPITGAVRLQSTAYAGSQEVA